MRRHHGELRRKSGRECIVSQDLSVLNLVIVKKCENDLPGLTDVEKPRMRGHNTASKIRNLSKEDDVRRYVNTYRHNFTNKAGSGEGSQDSKVGKTIDSAKEEAAEYRKLLATHLKEQREMRSECLAKKSQGSLPLLSWYH
ncbi:hypothetical protein M8C21_021714 [Ambrosia artemisiifolia]|uniref:40S ribosomal protein S6 n=1 Tax=Ambrosia artemisiifolia TaxID=4212 RepID=A0AAD5D3E0_AMBAR|nr:hypothetical protein M8C21_021714 [Ambrosia artemisiifolia]